MPCRCQALGLEGDPIQGLVMGRRAALSREDHSRALCLSSRDGFSRGSRPLRRLRSPPPSPGLPGTGFQASEQQGRAVDSPRTQRLWSTSPGSPAPPPSE
ncbi:unnamed protein product [Rangifer tarandus platyrhynchus]|uniref:Uncharacterized protein n=1 Tax=Rangifer tarandus platyrhynchus TaxID=3082113 RepID=A0ABN8ZHY1_RANTA|nr:unnamed protein product [Rangifer tarandus platyrhynchus]